MLQEVTRYIFLDFWSWSFFLQAGGEVEFQRLGKSVKGRVEYPKSDTDEDDGKDEGADESNGPEEDMIL